MTQATASSELTDIDIRDSGVVLPSDLEVGSGFSARQFRHTDFDGLMDPLIMADDYTMTEPTFGAHPHAGLSAVSLLFEDSQGEFFNHDSLGNHLVLGAGDLYWLSAGRGAVHDESPDSGDARIRGLQMFVKLPAAQSSMPPSSIYVPGAAMPSIIAPGTRVRVAAGESNGVKGESGTPIPVTLLDGYLDGGACFTHRLVAGQSAWIYAAEGEITVAFGGRRHRIQGGRAIALRTGAAPCEIRLDAVRKTHFVLMAATPLDESFVQQGPFALADMQQIERARADAEAGRMGRVERKPVTNR